LAAWIATLKLGFDVKLHWLPVHASWLDQIEIVFSQIQKKVLTPNHYPSLDALERTLMAPLAKRNQHAHPIRWSYTVEKLLRQRGAPSAAKRAA